MTDSKGYDVVVHFDTKEAADKFTSFVQHDNKVRIGLETYLEATYVETLECPR